MFKRFELKMNKAGDEGSAGGSGQTTEVKNESGNAAPESQGNAESTDASNSGTNVDVAAMQAEIEALRGEKESLLGKRDELLGKLKSSKEKLSAIEAEKKQKAIQEAEANGETEKLLAIYKEELDRTKQAMLDYEEKEEAKKVELLGKAKIQAVVNELKSQGHEFRDEAYLKFVDFNKVAFEGNKINKEGLKQAVAEVVERHSALIKPIEAKKAIPQDAPNGNMKKEMTMRERVEAARINNKK